LAKTKICRWFFLPMSLNIFALSLVLPFVIWIAPHYSMNRSLFIVIGLFTIFFLFLCMRGKLDMARASDWIFYRDRRTGTMSLIQSSFLMAAFLIIFFLEWWLQYREQF